MAKWAADQLSSLGVSAGPVRCVVFVGKTRYCHSASFHTSLNGYWGTVRATCQNAGGVRCGGGWGGER